MKRHLFTIITTICCLTLACGPSTNTNEKAKKVEKIIERPHYQMKYYSNWAIDTTDEDFDLDSYFSIDSPSGGGHISIFLFNMQVDDETNVQDQIDAMLENVVKNGTVTRFDNWGQFKGKGATIKGKLLGVFKGEIKIFSHSTDSSTFLTVSQINDNDRDMDLPGLKLIETSFRIK